jgi:hypothetical protein
MTPAPDLFLVPLTFRVDHRANSEVFSLPTVHRCDSMFCPRCGKRNRFEHLFHRLQVCGRELYEFPPSYRRGVERAGGRVPEPSDIADIVVELREIEV